MPITRRRFIEATGALSLTPVLDAAASATSQADARGVKVEKDIAFGKGDATELRCDIYHPSVAAEKRMALIHCHGGGFTRGSKNGLGGKVTPFAARGYVVIAAQYRLAGVARWPAPLEDVKACIRWTRANAARLGIDPARIAVVGYSAGGFLALMAAGTQNRPEFEGTGGNAGVSTSLAAAFAFYPATEVRPGPDGTAHPLMAPGTSLEDHSKASPTRFVESFPPTVLFHGVADTTIPLENSQRLFAQLQQAKIPAELHAYAGVPHEFDVHAEFAEEAARTTDFFLERHVIHPKTYPPFAFGARPPAPPR